MIGKINKEMFLTLWQKSRAYFWETKRGRYVGFIVILVLLALVIGIRKWTDANNQNEAQNIKEVKVSRLIDIGNSKGDLPLVGSVSSQSQVTLRAETQGQVVAVYKKLGDQVSAGDIIAEMENSAQRASVMQAQAALSGARAQMNNSQDSFVEASFSLKNSLRSAYTAADGVLASHLDRYFTNPQSMVPNFSITYSDGSNQITFSASDQNIGDLISKRRYLAGEAIKKLGQDVNNLENGQTVDLASAVIDAKKALLAVRDLTDPMMESINDFSTTDYRFKAVVDSYKSEIAGARSSVDGATAALSGASDAYNAKKTSGGSSGSLAASTVEQAEAGLMYAQANLQKTIVRSPISGTINMISPKAGDYVSMFSSLATVANNNALEIVTYVTEKEKDEISAGSKVVVENQYPAMVTAVSPAIDPQTGKIEVKIAMNQEGIKLINGQSVNLAIKRSLTSDSSQTMANASTTLDRSIIPLSALKVEPDRLAIFSIDKDNKIISHLVKEGPIFGDKILVYGAIDPNWEIILDARGLEAGETIKPIR